MSVARTVVNGGVPDSYTEAKAARGPAYNPMPGVLLTPERQLVGSHLLVMRYPGDGRRCATAGDAARLTDGGPYGNPPRWCPGISVDHAGTA